MASLRKGPNSSRKLAEQVHKTDEAQKAGDVSLIAVNEDEEQEQSSSGNNNNNNEPSNTTDPGSDDQGTKLWGGKMVDSIKFHKGNISLFSDDCLAIHGLYDAFYSRNGIARTIVYITTWIAFGIFFLWLTVPLVNDYRSKTATTYVDFAQGEDEGLPIPVVTVCPHGSGLRCDCLLWRRLYCRYTTEIVNKTYADRFGQYGCFSDFNESNILEPFWVNPQCDALDTFEDPCGPSPYFQERFPDEFTLDGLYAKAVATENETEGPILNFEDILTYGRERLDDRVIFYRNRYVSTLALRQTEPLNDKWVVQDYFEPSRLQYCVQLRVPQSERQTIPGAYQGVTVFVHNIKDRYPIGDAAMSVLAVDVHIQYVEEERYDDPFLFADLNEFFTVYTGQTTVVTFNTQVIQRYPGWGQKESQYCSNGVIPRNVCIEGRKSREVGVQCDCKSKVLGNNAHAIGCSAAPGTSQFECAGDLLQNVLPADLEDCPSLCYDASISVSSQQNFAISDAQLYVIRRNFLRSGKTNVSASEIDEFIQRSESGVLHIGAQTLAVKHYKETPKVSLSSLLGQIGGNAGLWCGLSFVLMLETLEFLMVTVLYGSGFYSGGRRPLGDRLKAIVARR